MDSSQHYDSKVLWSECFPHEFKEKLHHCPIAYLPLGLNEPHGQICAFGLDTIKAEYLCIETAKACGGLVAPTLGYQIHETGYHARWLEEEVGEENPHMTAIPPDIQLHYFLYQLRSFVNAGFKAVVVLSGHAGGNEKDYRLAAELFAKVVDIPIWVGTDAELAAPQYKGDHAGKFEVSQLMYIRPELVNFKYIELEEIPRSGGRLALGRDAMDASADHGKVILDVILANLKEKVSVIESDPRMHHNHTNLSIDQTQKIWNEMIARRSEWVTLQPRANQKPVSTNSKWKPYESI